MLCSAAPVGAATQLGQLAPAGPEELGCSSSNDFLQVSVSSGNSYEVPSSGVITQWSHKGDDDGDAGIGRLQVWTPAGGADFTLAGRSELQAFVPGVVNEFQIRIPVRQGDLLGMRSASAELGCYFTTGLPTDVIRCCPTVLSDPVPGETRTLPDDDPSVRINVAAILEPDCDQDGFGDETQDASVDCVVPETQITKGPKDKVKAKKKKAKATFEFSSSEPGVSFECSLDGQPFVPCVSPDTVKVRKGKHTFSVRARDAAGNVDASPASDGWKVKKKKK
jgi:hypothetical protein